MGLGNSNRNATSDAIGGTGVSRDPEGNINVNAANQSILLTTAAAATTVLTRESPTVHIISGSTTQTFQLPAVTNLPLGTTFTFINLSTGNVTIRTVGGAGTVRTLVANSSTVCRSVAITGTTAATWNSQYIAISFALAKSLTINKILTLTAIADSLTLNIGIIGGTLAHVGYIEPTGGYTVAALTGAPPADLGNVGDRTFVTDALGPVFGAVVVGLGAVFVPVYFDGANWRVG